MEARIGKVIATIVVVLGAAIVIGGLVGILIHVAAWAAR